MAGVAERSCGVHGPVGIAEEFTSQQDQVGLAVANDLIGLGRLRDHAHGTGGNSGFAADAVGEGRLVTGAEGDPDSGYQRG